MILVLSDLLDIKCNNCPNEGNKCRACVIAHLRRVLKDSTLHDNSS